MFNPFGILPQKTLLFGIRAMFPSRPPAGRRLCRPGPKRLERWDVEIHFGCKYVQMLVGEQWFQNEIFDSSHILMWRFNPGCAFGIAVRLSGVIHV
jgi:hypothetical protein